MTDIHSNATTSAATAYPDERTTGSASLASRPRTRRVSTETKAAFKTTEFFVYVLSVIGVLIASMVVGNDSNTGANGASTGDYFRADKAWMLIAALTIGYMLARGFAKSGSRDYYDDDAR